jgi:hypothetical protein
MKKYYSRLAKLEERKNLRSAFLYGSLTITFVLILVFYGIPFATRIAGIFGDIKSSTDPIQKTDNIPPAPPTIKSPPEFSNQDKIVIEGSSEPGATVILFLNGASNEIVCDASGNFSSDFNLQDGENSVYAIAVDNSGNKSKESNHYKIIQDKTPPRLTIQNPQNNSSFYGEKQRQITIEGQSDPDSNVSINDHQVLVEADGSFKSLTQLNEGDNTFKIKSQDKAGNATEVQIKVSFSP